MIEYGYCHCGCGEKTRLAPQTVKSRGWVKGEPVRYLPSHGTRGRKFTKSRGIQNSELVCTACEKIKPVSQFRWIKSAETYDWNCESCRFAKYRMYKYSLTREELDKLLETCYCEICEVSFQTVVPHIDHDHVTGEVRGLLCVNCNTLLGHSKDNANILRKAVEYLEKER